MNSQSSFADERAAMVQRQLRERGIRDERVLDAMAAIPREKFLPREHRHLAYRDHPVVIGEGQTISQPYIVAAMLEYVRIGAQDKVLEIGTGTGYEAAILGRLAREVVTIERHASLADRARKILEELGGVNIKVETGDGSFGYPLSAPYDVIVVAAAAAVTPPALLDQLSEQGRMIIPLGDPDTQVLHLLRKEQGKIQTTLLDSCRFVPLIGDAAQ